MIPGRAGPQLHFEEGTILKILKVHLWFHGYHNTIARENPDGRMMKMDAQMIFKRYELKYMLTRAQRDALLSAMQGHMVLDQYGHSTIRNIYYDTDTW